MAGLVKQGPWVAGDDRVRMPYTLGDSDNPGPSDVPWMWRRIDRSDVAGFERPPKPDVDECAWCGDRAAQAASWGITLGRCDACGDEFQIMPLDHVSVYGFDLQPSIRQVWAD